MAFTLGYKSDTRTVSPSSSGLSRTFSSMRGLTSSFLILSLLLLVPVTEDRGTVLAKRHFSCARVKEYFAKYVDSKTHVPAHSVPDTLLNVCSDTLAHTSGSSCCTKDMEAAFLRKAPLKLQEYIYNLNSELRSRIKQSNDLFNNHLRKTLLETRTKLSDTLKFRFTIPESETENNLNTLFDNLHRFFQGSDELGIEVIVHHFFSNLFQPVVEYTLAKELNIQQTSRPAGAEFRSCVRASHDEIEPFSSVPFTLGRQLKHAFKRALIFSNSLHVLLTAVEMADQAAGIDESCAYAFSRLRFCSMCSANEETLPCRGLCLNVMRGCLSKSSEVSSTWDDLIVDFQQLIRSMRHRPMAQGVLAQLDTNVTMAILRAMDKKASVYNEVMSLCRHKATASMASGSAHASLTDETINRRKRFASPDQLLTSTESKVMTLSKDHIERQIILREDLAQLERTLVNSKGFLLDLPDELCRERMHYVQQMDSDRCWNGSAIGRYMNLVPEENMMSQLQNKEVNVTLTTDRQIRTVKDTLSHMKKELSSLQSEERMFNDDAYRTVDGPYASGGSGHFYGSTKESNEFIGDDEDWNGLTSGSGSGNYPDEDREDGSRGTDKHTPTATLHPDTKGRNPNSRPTNKGKQPTAGRDKGDNNGFGRNEGPKDAACTVSMSFTLLVLSTVTSWLYLGSWS